MGTTESPQTRIGPAPGVPIAPGASESLSARDSRALERRKYMIRRFLGFVRHGRGFSLTMTQLAQGSMFSKATWYGAYASMSDVWLDAALVNAELQLGYFTDLARGADGAAARAADVPAGAMPQLISAVYLAHARRNPELWAAATSFKMMCKAPNEPFPAETAPLKAIEDAIGETAAGLIDPSGTADPRDVDALRATVAGFIVLETIGPGFQWSDPGSGTDSDHLRRVLRGAGAVHGADATIPDEELYRLAVDVVEEHSRDWWP